MRTRSGMVLLLLIHGWRAPSAAADSSKPPPALTDPCPPSDCATTGCANRKFVPTHCSTTPCGPARANVVVGSAIASPNMLWCPGAGPYALCFFSGPPSPTGNPPVNKPNKTLPCIVNPETGIADCTCQVYNNGSYYVDINSILNLELWHLTTDACGPDGSLCKNIRDCSDDGKSIPFHKTRCPSKTAPVCDYIANQGKGSDPSKWFYPDPGSADLVSTFSYAMSGPYGTTSGPYTLGATPCRNGLYAGCMTAPCKYPPGTERGVYGSVVHCSCPTWTGDFQVGQNGQSCSLPSYQGLSFVWSAANSVPSTSSCTTASPSKK